MRTDDSLIVTLPSDREIALTRVFNAPRTLVFEALTTPALLKRWLLDHAGLRDRSPRGRPVSL